jgi:predicted  nucleic acid-binding Zn-ribbon protein
MTKTKAQYDQEDARLRARLTSQKHFLEKAKQQNNTLKINAIELDISLTEKAIQRNELMSNFATDSLY